MAKEAEEKAGTDVNAAKMKALQATLDKIEKDFGKGAIMPLGQQANMEVSVIPSGSIALDHALGIGGYPRGRVIEIYGPESSGKTTLAIHAIAQAQKQGGIAAIIDAEHAFDRTYAKNLGVDLDTLLISQPDNGEQALEIADDLIRSGAIDIIVIDSVAALTPKAEIEGEMGDSKMGLQARLMSQALRKLTANISKTNTCCIFINQLRDKIGVMFGNPETTTGGNALKFYASVRLDIRRRIYVAYDGQVVVLPAHIFYSLRRDHMRHRAVGRAVRHDDPFLRIEDFRAFSHETYAGEHDRLRVSFLCLLAQVKRIADVIGDALYLGRHVVMGQHDGALFFFQPGNFLFNQFHCNPLSLGRQCGNSSGKISIQSLLNIFSLTTRIIMAGKRI